MYFSEFVQTLNKLEQTPSRNQKIEILSDLFKKLDKTEIKPAMYLLIGRVAPKYISKEFNFSEKLILRGIALALNLKLNDVIDVYSKYGDLGETIFNLKMKGIYKNFQINDIFIQLNLLSSASGQGAVDKKLKIFTELIYKVDPLSAKFIIRIILSKLRLGLNEKTLLDALSWTVAKDKNLRKLLDRAYGARGDIGFIAEMVLEKKLEYLKDIKILPGVPVASKLVEREKSIEDAFRRMGKSIVQWKYDGLRTQIHKFQTKGDALDTKNEQYALIDSSFSKNVKIFSRNMEELTNMFPEILSDCQNLNLLDVVLDSETVGFDEKDNRFISFQDTIKRRRKYDVKKKQKSIPIKTFVFDVLYVNGVDISARPLKYRLAVLDAIFQDFKGHFLQKYKDDKLVKQLLFRSFDKDSIKSLKKTKSILVSEVEDLKTEFNNAVQLGLEGLIIKNIDSEYVPGTRNYDWIKLKASIDKELVDTIDVVVLGLYYGKGLRSKFGAGAFLVGVYNKDIDVFQTIAKIGTGIKDSDWKRIVSDIKKYRVNDLPKNVEIDKTLMPDILCEPKIVAVVEADEITLSKNHTAGRKSNGVGYSLRFPRLKQWNRFDKDVYQITDVKEIIKMYEIRKNNDKNPKV